MRQRPDALAWLVIGSSFAVFCLIVAVVSMGMLWYRTTATQAKEARLEIISGTVLVRGPNQAMWVSGVPDMTLDEGYSIKTDETSQALITLFDDSKVILYSGTEVQLAKLSSARYGTNDWIELFQVNGKAHIGVAPTVNSRKEFEVNTSQAAMSLSEGSFSIKVAEDWVQIRVQDRGEALVSAGGDKVALKPGQRTQVTAGGKPESSQEAIEDLIFNGDFSQSLTGWRYGNIGFRQGQDVIGEVITALEDGKPAVRFHRVGSKGAHCESYIFQEINKDVSDLSSLELSVEFKIVHQSLSGGGYMGSEYPMLIRIDYTALEGSSFSIYGYYYQNEADNRTDNGTQVPQNIWQRYTVIGNVMALSPKPRKITSIQVSASGWDYDSFISTISLIGK